MQSIIDETSPTNSGSQKLAQTVKVDTDKLILFGLNYCIN